MRDGKLIFGVATLATKDTDVYCADVLDFGDNTTGNRLSETHLTGNQDGLRVVFNADVALASGDYWIPFIADCATVDGTYVNILTGPAIAAASAAGTQVTIPFPLKHNRFVKAGFTPKSGGTFTEKTASAYIVSGAKLD